MDPAAAIDGSATLVSPLAPVVPVMAPSLTRDSFNSQSLGRGLNAHVKQVGTALPHPTQSFAAQHSTIHSQPPTLYLPSSSTLLAFHILDFFYLATFIHLISSSLAHILPHNIVQHG